MPGLNKVMKNLKDWQVRNLAASLALAQNWAGVLEKDMKENAPWQDRTGNARQGLYGTASMDSKEIKIRIGHTMDYGVFLELARDGKYAILKPTRAKHQRDIRESFQELWGE